MEFSQIKQSQKPKIFETFQMVKHANLEGSNLDDQQIEKVQELFMGPQQVFSRNSNDLGYCDKIKHKINSTKVKSGQKKLLQYEL